MITWRGGRPLTPEEDAAITRLEALSRKWPKTLKLFSWSGTLCVMDAASPPGEAAIVARISGIPNDGGDP